LVDDDMMSSPETETVVRTIRRAMPGVNKKCCEINSL